MIELGGGIFAAKNVPIFIGLVFGTFAKFGRMIAAGAIVTWRAVVGHIMMMGVCGLVALMATDTAKIDDPNGRAFAAAIIAIAASDVIQWLGQRAWKRFLIDARYEAEKTAEALVQARGELRQNVQIAESTEAVLSRKKGDTL